MKEEQNIVGDPETPGASSGSAQQIGDPETPGANEVQAFEEKGDPETPGNSQGVTGDPETPGNTGE